MDDKYPFHKCLGCGAILQPDSPWYPEDHGDDCISHFKPYIPVWPCNVKGDILPLVLVDGADFLGKDG